MTDGRATSSAPLRSHLPPPHPVRIRPRVRDSDRKRAARACWRCRDRKSRCIVRKENGNEICQRCLKNKWECIFGDFPDDGTGGSALLSPDSERNNPWANEAPVDSRQDQSRRSRSLSDTGRNDAGTIPKRAPEAAHLVVKNRDPHRTHLVGEVSSNYFLSKVQDAVVADSPGGVQKEMPSEHMLSLDTNSTDDELLKIALEGFPPRNVADFLVETFFHSVEANYYYMDRDRFRTRLERCYAEMTPESVDHDASFVCLALIVFAMGSQFAGLRAPSQLVPSLTVSKHGPGMVFYVKAKLLLSDVITTGSLESIQALFLIGLFLLPSNTSDLSYVYHGTTLKMAMAAGLHRKIVDSTGLDQRVMHVRNRLWWSLYTSERRLTIILDRPESIREEDIDAPLPEYSPDLDPPHAGDNIYNLQASIKLCRIHNRAVRLGKAMDFADPEAEAKIQEIKKELERWAAELPPSLQIANITTEQKSFRGAVHLHMNYNQIIIYMGRTALLRRVQEHLHRIRDKERGSVPSPVDTSDDGTRDAAEERLSRDSVNAAYRIIDYVRFLYEMNRLARFSFTDMHCCTSAAIILMIHEVVGRHPLFKTHMAAVLQCMQFMASGCENARISLRVIQNIYSMTTAIKNKYPPPPMVPEDKPPAADATQGRDGAGYEQWETWMSGAGNWSIGSRKHMDASRLAATSESTSGWRVETAPTEYSTVSAAQMAAVFPAPMVPQVPPDTTGYVPDAMQAGLVYNWPDELNSLGLQAFEGLQFPMQSMQDMQDLPR